MHADLYGPLAILGAVIREHDAPERMASSFEDFLADRGASRADIEAMLDVGAQRFEVYRKLVHNRIRNVCRDFLPRTHARIGPGRFARDVGVFLDACGVRSPYLRDVPGEFVRHVAGQWLEDPDISDYLADLARHELLECDVRNDPRGGEAPTGRPLALHEPLVFDGAARLMRYDYAVHCMSVDVEDHAEPERTPTQLLVYRDAASHVRYLELTPFAARVTEALMVRGLRVCDGLAWAAAESNDPLDDAKLAIAAQFLADLADRGVMLGAAHVLDQP